MATERNSVELVDADVVGLFARAALLAALMGAASYVSIPLPFSPVPVTLQVLVVYLAGLYLGPLWGGASVGLFLAAGAVGAPVFAEGKAGVGVLVGYTGGYLLGYLLGAVLVGLLVHRSFDRLRDPAETSLPVLVGSLVAALALIYALGVVWFAHVQQVELAAAIGVAIVPFIPGDILKIVTTIAIAKRGVIDPV